MSERDDRLEDGMADEPEPSGDPTSPEDARLLRELVDDLRAAPLPELDWGRVERALEARLAAERRSELAARRRRIASSLLVAAAAAVLVLALGDFFTGEPVDHQPVAERAGGTDLSAVPRTDDGAYQVGALAPATAIDSGEEAMRFGLPGVVTWTIAPHSRVVIDTVTVPHTVTLERGRIDAEVVPRGEGAPEVFAVITGSTRVAVRGTVFSVARDDAAVTVEVSRGKVAVGPMRGGAPELLVSPARARFSLAGELLRERADAELTEDDGATPGRNDHVPSAVAERNDAEPPAPGAPATEEDVQAPSPSVETPVRISVASARGIVLGCLRQALASAQGDDREITVSSAVTVTLGPGGRVDAVRFSPPLRPDLQQRCGGALFGHELEAEGKASFHVAVTR